MSSERIAVFLSMDDEVRTKEIIKHVFKLGKSCFIPRYKSNSSHMDMLKLNSLQDIETLPLTSWNIRQPAEDDNSREEALATGKHVHKQSCQQTCFNLWSLSQQSTEAWGVFPDCCNTQQSLEILFWGPCMLTANWFYSLMSLGVGSFSSVVQVHA